MSSHREAPQISLDPVADSSDLYAFVSPDHPDTVTVIANYVPLQGPAGGPNFYEFGDDVLYEIKIDNNGDGVEEISFQFRFATSVGDPNTFLYNTGPIASLSDARWNRRQSYSVTRVQGGKSMLLGTGLACPPCNIGPLSTPDYSALATEAVHSLTGGISVFAGQRAEGFYVDLGSIFDLGTLRPFQELHASALFGPVPGVNATKALNVHSIAIQVPKAQLASTSSSTIGVWTTASRQKARILGNPGHGTEAGPFVQVSRLGNPLINEVVIPLGQKDYWNTEPPSGDSQFASLYSNPELAQLLPDLYPGVFGSLASYNSGPPPPNRADLVAILLTGIPSGIKGLPAGYSTFTGSVQSDLLRLNMGIAPASSPSNLGILGGDVAGFPNGRRVFDDVVTIELRCIAGATLPLVDPTFKADPAAGAIDQGLTSSGSDLSAKGTEAYLSSFPYLGTPYSGFDVPAA